MSSIHLKYSNWIWRRISASYQSLCRYMGVELHHAYHRYKEHKAYRIHTTCVMKSIQYLFKAERDSCAVSEYIDTLEIRFQRRAK